MVWNKVPYTNFHDLNQDWIVRRMQEFIEEMDNIVALSVVKYADPIQWNITHQYEQSTIAIDAETGTAYISVKPVPAGVAITNTSYWTPVFDLSELFGDLEQQISDEAAARTAAINAEASARTAAINAETSARQAADNTINNRLTAIETELGNLDDREFIFIGDSFGEGWTPDGSTTPFPELFKDHYNIENSKWHSSQVSGSGFCNGSTFLTQLTSLYSSITDRTKITDIYVLGGRNDFGYSPEQIKQAKIAFINYAKVNYPNATIKIGFIGRSFEFTDATSMVRQYNTLVGYREDCELYGAIYLNKIDYCLNNMSFFASDHKHPNQNGQNSILQALVSLYESGNYDYNKAIFTSLTPSVSGNDVGDITMTQTGDLITVIINPCQINLNTSGALNNKKIELGTFNNMLCPGVNYPTYMATAQTVIGASDNKYYNAPGSFYINQNKLYVNLLLANATNDGYFNANYTKIQIGGLCFTYSANRGD